MPLLLACVAAGALVLAAPFIGQVRGAIQNAFPGQYVLILVGALVSAVIVAGGVALARIREQKARRFGAIAAALAGAALYAAVTATGNREVDAVERVHFIEYGVIALLFYRACRPSGDAASFILPLLAGVIVGTLDEWLQWFIPARVGEAHDVFLNLVALACGLVFAAAVWPPRSWSSRLRPDSREHVARLGAVTLLVFAGFFSSVHLGQRVRADGIGAFLSHYSGDELLTMANDRSERWRRDPPVTLRRFSREDQYLDEGLWHVRRRNELWQAGDIGRSWRENLILERYFAPVIDTPSYASREVNRWSPAQRADAEGRGGYLSADAFISDAQLYPVRTWPKWLFWSVAAALAFGLLSASRLRRASPR